MSRETRKQIVTVLRWRLSKAIKEKRSSAWINLLIEEIEKHTTALNRE